MIKTSNPIIPTTSLRGSTADSFDEGTDDAEYCLVIERLKAAYDAPGGNNGKVEPTAFRRRLEEAFDESYVRFIPGSEPAGRETMISELLEMSDEDSQFQFGAFRYRRASCESRCIEVFLHCHSFEHHIIAIGKWYYNRTARIVRSEITRTFQPKVAGEVTADAHAKLTHLLTEREFTRNVQPRSDTAPLLSGSTTTTTTTTGIQATNVPYQMIRVHMHQCCNLWQEGMHKKNDQIALLDHTGHPYANGAYFRNHKRLIGDVRSWTLFEHNQPVALCKKVDHGFTIYGTRPLMQQGEHQHSEAVMEEVQLEDGTMQVTAFFPWYRVRSMETVAGKIAFVYALSQMGDSVDPQVDFEPIYKVVTVDAKNNKRKGAENNSNSSLYQIKDYYSCDTVGVIRNELGIHGILRHKKCPSAPTEEDQENNNNNPNQWLSMFQHGLRHYCRTSQVDISPGSDPTLILCIAACLEEMEL